MSEARNATTEGAVSQGEYVDLLGEQYYCIRAYDLMAPFFMSVISSADHWLFISSTGGLTAGRINAESALARQIGKLTAMFDSIDDPYLRERKSDEAYDDWLRQLRDRTYVELRLDPQ